MQLVARATVDSNCRLVARLCTNVQQVIYSFIVNNVKTQLNNRGKVGWRKAISSYIYVIVCRRRLVELLCCMSGRALSDVNEARRYKSKTFDAKA